MFAPPSLWLFPGITLPKCRKKPKGGLDSFIKKLIRDLTKTGVSAIIEQI